MSLPAVLIQSASPSAVTLDMTEGATCKRVVSFKTSAGVAVPLGSTTTAEVVIYNGRANAPNAIVTTTGTVSSEAGTVTFRLTPAEVETIGDNLVWPPDDDVVTDQLRWLLRLTDGTDTVVTHLGAVAFRRAEHDE